MASGGLPTGGAGTPGVGSESGAFGTGGANGPKVSITELFAELSPALDAPKVLFLPFADTKTEPLALPAVVTFTRPPSALEMTTLANALDWAEVIDADANSSSVDSLAASPPNEPCKCNTPGIAD